MEEHAINGRPAGEYRRSTANGHEWQAQVFERQRPHLQAVAYRMLGSVTEAEDAVQLTWLRLSRSDDAITNMGGWLTTVVGRVCVDMLRARQSRREDYVGTWLPEPIVQLDEADSPEGQAVIADSVGLAMFGVPFQEIAPMIDRSPAATRQLASRARRTVRGAPTVADPDLTKQREIVAAFLAAARAADFGALVAVLDPDVVFRIDTGDRPAMAPALLTGSADVARHAATYGPRFAKLCRPALVNGAAGIIARAPAGVIAVAGITVVRGRILAVDLILDPDKLAALTIRSTGPHAP
jgi:hypothetical protein